MAKRPVFQEVLDPAAPSRPVTTTGMIDAARNGASRGARRAIRGFFKPIEEPSQVELEQRVDG